MNGGTLLLALSLCVACASGAAQSDEQAESATTAPEPKTLGTIVVVGTHIRHVDLETQHPLLVLDRADIQRTGLTSISDIVQ